MEFGFTQEQSALGRAAIEFARGRLNQGVTERDQKQEFSHDAWRQCAEFGVQGLPFPSDLGGSATDIVTTSLIMEGLGFGCQDNGLLFALNAQMWSVQMPIWRFGSPEQQQRYLLPMCRGEMIGAHGMTEPGSGSDAFSLQTRAERRGDCYVLNGQKTFATNAPVADAFLVFATTRPKLGQLGISAFLLERETRGLQVGPPLAKMGLRTSPMAEIFMDDCAVPLSARLGREGNGAAIFGNSMAWERACLLATCVGAMQRQLDRCVRYVKTREQFGQAIGKFQAVSHRIADMQLRIDAARLLLYRVAWLKQQGRAAGAEAAMAKIMVSESWVQNSQDAIQLHGGYGYMTEMEVERDLRDAIASKLYSGTSEIQRSIIATHLGIT
jgi:alkylation response protein AidB-like acyl-CoA dehydrogenase